MSKLDEWLKLQPKEFVDEVVNKVFEINTIQELRELEMKFNPEDEIDE